MSEYTGCRDQKWGFRTYAQHGDDLMIMNLFELLGQKRFNWLDLGAHHPLDISNTALAYSYGNSGVNVEANPDLASEFVRARPRDTTLNVGVANLTGVLPFFVYGERSGRNTFSEEEVKSMKGKMSVQRTLKIPVFTINDIVKRWCHSVWPDLLLTDIEGFDYSVLESAIFGGEENSPKVIVTEVRREDSIKFIKMLKPKGYEFYCRMGENMFLTRRDIWEKVC